MLEALYCVVALVWRRLCGGTFLCCLCLGDFGGVLISGRYYIGDSIVLGPLLCQGGGLLCRGRYCVGELLCRGAIVSRALLCRGLYCVGGAIVLGALLCRGNYCLGRYCVRVAIVLGALLCQSALLCFVRYCHAESAPAEIMINAAFIFTKILTTFHAAVSCAVHYRLPYDIIFTKIITLHNFRSGYFCGS